jgi:hypothetical protein
MLNVMRLTLALVTAALVATMAVGEELFVPRVAERQDQDGAWWSTEVWVSNTTASTAGYAAVFLSGDKATNLDELQSDPPLEDIPPGATIHRTDLVPQGGSGALRVIVTPGVLVFSRTSSAAGHGSSAQGMRAMPRSSAVRPGEVAYLVALRRTPQFRTNLGLLNPGLEGGTVTVRLISQRGEAVSEQNYRLGPGAVVQLDDALHSFGVVRGEHLRAELSGTVPFFAYATVIDTRSGAPTLVLPMN